MGNRAFGTPAFSVALCVCAAGAAFSPRVAFSQEDIGSEPVSLVQGESRFGVRTAVNYTDNALRTTDNERSSTYGSVGLDLDYRRNGPKLQLNAVGDIDYVKYFNEAYGSAPIGNLSGTLRWGAPDDFFNWLAQDRFGQVRSDPLITVTPATIENVNTFTTGPSFNIRLGGATRLGLYGYYSLTDYEKSPFDSDNVNFGASLTRDVSSTSSLGLDVTEQQVRFDNATAFGDYDVDAAYVRYSSTGSRTTLRADVGYTRIRPEIGESTGGALFRFDAERQITTSSFLYVNASQQFSNSGNSLGNSSSGSGLTIGPSVGTASGIATGDPYKERFASGGWRFVRSRNSLRVALDWRQERYETQTQFDRTSVGFEVIASRRLRPTVDLTVSFRSDSQDLDNAPGSSDDRLFSVLLSRTVGRHLDVALSLDHFDRSGSSGQTVDYKENRIGLRATYNVLAR